MRTMFLKHARRRKFTKLVTNHVLGHKDRLKRLAVVYEKCVANKIWRDHRASRPGFDRFLRARIIHLIDLLQKMRFDEGSFFK